MNRLGIVSPAKTGSAVIQDPVLIATEGAPPTLGHAQWGSAHAHGFLQDAAVLSGDAGQFDIGQHALCRVHAERPVHKPIRCGRARLLADRGDAGRAKPGDPEAGIVIKT